MVRTIPAGALVVASLLVARGAFGTGLPEVVQAGEREEARVLIDNGADVNERSSDGTTALMWAAHRGDFELLQLLLEHGANATVTNDYGATALSAAAVEGDYRIIEALLEAGADADSPNAEGETALMVVARTGHVDTARLLLARGADVNATETWGGQSALMWAAAQGHPAMIRLLLEQGAEVDARGRVHDWQRRVTAEPRIKIMHVGGFTPLLYAARGGCAACVEALLDGGADIELADPDGITPLLLALLNLHYDTAAVLIERGADVNRWDWWGRSPLFVAIDLDVVPSSRRGDLPSLDRLSGLDVARMLLERGAFVDMRLKHQPPMRAEPADRGFVDGSTDAWIMNSGATALHTAAKASNDAAIRLLLDYDADVSRANVFGITPLLAAAGVGHLFGIFRDYPSRGRYKTGADAVATMKLLIDAGADLNVRTRDGQTAAHGAASVGWNEVLLYLRGLGADLDVADAEGATPRDVALAAEKTDTVALLDRLLAEQTDDH